MNEFFSFLKHIARAPIVCENGQLTAFEQFLLVEAYDFFKDAAHYPLDSPETTLLEYEFLCKSYPMFEEIQPQDINDPNLKKAMKEMGLLDGGMTY